MSAFERGRRLTTRHRDRSQSAARWNKNLLLLRGHWQSRWWNMCGRVPPLKPSRERLPCITGARFASFLQCCRPPTAFAAGREPPLRCAPRSGETVMLELLERQQKLTLNQKKIVFAAIVGDMLDFFDYYLI